LFNGLATIKYEYVLLSALHQVDLAETSLILLIRFIHLFKNKK